MNWEALGAIGEIVGAIAVVVTLVYLALQVRSSARATEAQVHASLSSEMEHLATSMAQDDALSEAMSLALKSKDLTEKQQIKLSWWFGGFLRVCESHIIQRRLGSTGIHLEKPVSTILKRYAHIDFFRKILADTVRDGTASAEFLEFLQTDVLDSVSEAQGSSNGYLGAQALFGKEREK